MGLADSVKSILSASEPSRRRPDDSEGAYWCDDCNVRIRDVDLAGEPICPECGTEMRFERSTGDGCAC